MNVFGKMVALGLVLPAAAVAQDAGTTVGTALGATQAGGGVPVQSADSETATPLKRPPEGTPPDGEPGQDAEAGAATPFVADDGQPDRAEDGAEAAADETKTGPDGEAEAASEGDGDDAAQDQPVADDTDVAAMEDGGAEVAAEADGDAADAPDGDAEGAVMADDAAMAADGDAPEAPEDGTEVAAMEDGGAEAPAEATPEPDPLAQAAAECLAIAGPADAGVPAAAVDATSQKEMLARAAPFCTEAAGDEDADPEVLFHAASVARASGDAQSMFDLLTRAAEAGLGAAETRLGDAFLFGVAPGGQDIKAAVAHYQAAADLEDAAGMTTLALLHQVGQGVPQDAGRMVDLMTRAAEQGYHFAQFRLAQVYHRGDGVPGRTDAGLGIPDRTRALTLYARATEAGNLDAALALSALYSDPSFGLSDDPAEQVRLTRIVSRTGFAPAIARMGVFYETGRGVDYSPAIAAGLYVKAMETGELAFEDLRAGAPFNWDDATALEFQKILAARGLYTGALDAIVGPGTAGAARALAAE